MAIKGNTKHSQLIMAFMAMQAYAIMTGEAKSIMADP